MTKLKPWVTGPYELLRHAELHLTDGNDFDRRMALINYDNAIELAISTYLSLDPKQRAGRCFPRDKVPQWIATYHSKLDFLEHYVVDVLKQTMRFEKDEILYYHRIRNDLYHSNGVLVPRAEDVSAVRGIAHWVFARLYGIDPEPLLQAEAAGLSAVVTTTLEPPIESQFFAALMELRKDIAQLKQHTKASSATTDEQVVDGVLGAEPAPATDRLKDALRRAKEIAGYLKEDRPVSASKDELDQLIQLLEQLKHRVEIPLRAYQEQLAGRALDATVAAVAARRHLIGHIYQPTGSGLSTTALEYLRRVISNDILRDFTILVATDRTMFVDQLYERVSRAEFLRSRPVRCVSRAEITPELLRDPLTLLVTSTQALRSDGFPRSAPDKTLVVAFDLDLNQPTMMTSLLTQRYVISFTNSMSVSDAAHGNLIASYSLHQAQLDGVLTPLTFEIRPPPIDQMLDLPPGFELVDEQETLDEESRGSSTWTEARIQAISEDIVEHFKSQSEEPATKALVIVRKVEDALRFSAALRKGFFDDNGTPDEFVQVVMSSMQSEDSRHIVREFTSPEAYPLILVCGRTWMGFDLAIARCAYLTCRLSAEEFWKLAGQLCARHPGKSTAIVVDYAGNRPGDLLRQSEV